MTTLNITIYQDPTARRVCPCCNQPHYSPYYERCQGTWCDYESHEDAYELQEAPSMNETDTQLGTQTCQCYPLGGVEGRTPIQ